MDRQRGRQAGRKGRIHHAGTETPRPLAMARASAPGKSQNAITPGLARRRIAARDVAVCPRQHSIETTRRQWTGGHVFEFVAAVIADLSMSSLPSPREVTGDASARSRREAAALSPGSVPSPEGVSPHDRMSAAGDDNRAGSQSSAALAGGACRSPKRRTFRPGSGRDRAAEPDRRRSS